jgi:hypothetical protein
MDIPAVEETMRLIEQAGQANKSAIPLNAVPAHTSEGQEAAEVLSGIGELLPVSLGDRVDFRRGGALAGLAARSKTRWRWPRMKVRVPPNSAIAPAMKSRSTRLRG